MTQSGLGPGPGPSKPKVTLFHRLTDQTQSYSFSQIDSCTLHKLKQNGLVAH